MYSIVSDAFDEVVNNLALGLGVPIRTLCGALNSKSCCMVSEPRLWSYA